MGHTSVLVKGLFLMVVVLLAAFAVAGGVAFALASLFHHVAAFVILGGAALLAASYVAYQPRWVCLAYGSLGSLGGYIAFLLTAIFGGGFLPVAVLWALRVSPCSLACSCYRCCRSCRKDQSLGARLSESSAALGLLTWQ